VPDVNAIVRTYLLTDAALVALVGSRIYSPRLPDKAALPAIGHFVRGGLSTPYVKEIISPSVQFDCWAEGPIEARQVYLALYDALQGIHNVTVGSNVILSAREEVQGQDLQDVDISDRYRVLTFFEIMVR
jgi:hypothetical protein